MMIAAASTSTATIIYHKTNSKAKYKRTSFRHLAAPISSRNNAFFFDIRFSVAVDTSEVNDYMYFYKFSVLRGFTIPSHIYGIGDAICQYPVNLPDMSLLNVSLESQCVKRTGRGHYGIAFDARRHELFYSENATQSIGRISLANEMGELIMKGLGEVQGAQLL